MRKYIAGLVVTTLLAGAYIASPLHAAWTIREAIRDGNSAILQQRIVWPTVRETLRTSLTEIADPAPEPALASSATRKGLWARFKSYASRRAVENLVDSYATAEGLPQLFSYGVTYRNVVHGASEPKTLANLPARMMEFWSRMKRAEFRSLTAFEVEVQDKHTPSRHYTGLLELHGASWMLTQLRVHTQATGNAELTDS